MAARTESRVPSASPGGSDRARAEPGPALGGLVPTIRADPALSDPVGFAAGRAPDARMEP